MAIITITFESDETRCGKTIIAKALKNALEKVGYNVEFDFSTFTRKQCNVHQIKKQYFSDDNIDFSKLLEPKANIIIIPE